MLMESLFSCFGSPMAYFLSLCVLKFGPSLFTCLSPALVANFGVKILEIFRKFFVFDRTSKSNCDISLSFPTSENFIIFLSTLFSGMWFRISVVSLRSLRSQFG